MEKTHKKPKPKKTEPEPVLVSGGIGRAVF